MTLDRLSRDFRRLPAFGAAGLAGTLVQYAVQGVLMMPNGVPPTAAASIGYGCGFLINHQLNRRHTFASRRPAAATLWRYGAVAAIGLALNTLLIHWLVVRGGLPWLPVQILATGLVFAGNYLGCLHWVFRDAHASD